MVKKIIVTITTAIGIIASCVALAWSYELEMLAWIFIISVCIEAFNHRLDVIWKKEVNNG